MKAHNFLDLFFGAMFALIVVNVGGNALSGGLNSNGALVSAAITTVLAAGLLAYSYAVFVGLFHLLLGRTGLASLMITSAVVSLLMGAGVSYYVTGSIAQSPSAAGGDIVQGLIVGLGMFAFVFVADRLRLRLRKKA
jgi:hypothetical protein